MKKRNIGTTIFVFLAICFMLAGMFKSNDEFYFYCIIILLFGNIYKD